MKILPVLGQQDGVQEYWAEMQKYGVDVDETNPEYIPVLGGDGTFLGAERAYYKMGVPFVGVGFGHVNFLLNRRTGSPKDFVESLRKKEWVTFPIYGINAEITTRHGMEQGIAFNDVYIKSLDPTGVVRLELTTREYAQLNVVGDGVIVATPQGSTAYNRNAGGTILPLGSSLWCLTGICTQKSLRVTVAQQEIVIAVRSNDAIVVTDNNVFRDVLAVKITPSIYEGTICFGTQENFEQKRYES
ncbi:MAG: NAD(+)/NADH kinase [Parcubacteria group bacterium]|jgi:NAD+ kinase